MDFVKKIKFNHLAKFPWRYILVVLSIVLPWFFRSDYLFFTDLVWGPHIYLYWSNSWFLINLLIKVLYFIFPLAFLEKLFISGILILILAAGRRLVQVVLAGMPDAASSHGLIFILPLFALFNPFVYDHALYGQFGILAAYGCLLFVAAYLLEAGRTLDFKRLWRAALFSAIALLFSLHFIFLLAPFYLLFSIALVWRHREIKTVGQTKKLLSALLLSILIIFLLNTNWLVALAIGASPIGNFVAQGITSRDLEAFSTSGRTTGETYANVILMSGFWGKDQYRYADLTAVSGWQKGFIFLLPLIIYGVYLSFHGRTRGEKIFSASLLVLYVFAITLAVGIKSPVTGPLTQFLYDHLPFYKGLREPQKWVAVIIPIYLFYLTLASARLYSSKFISDKRWLAGTLLGLVIIMQAPLLLWGFAGQAKPTPYPDDWIATDRLLVDRSADSYGCSDRILFLPWHLYLSFYWSGKIMANPAPHFFSCPVLSGTNMEWGGIYDNSLNPDGAAVSAWLAERGVNGPPAVAGTPLRYIILAKEVDFTSYLWLNDLPYLTPISESLRLIVYEIK